MVIRLNLKLCSNKTYNISCDKCFRFLRLIPIQYLKQIKNVNSSHKSNLQVQEYKIQKNYISNIIILVLEEISGLHL